MCIELPRTDRVLLPRQHPWSRTVPPAGAGTRRNREQVTLAAAGHLSLELCTTAEITIGEKSRTPPANRRCTVQAIKRTCPFTAGTSL
jgi:hypothetical protein